MTSTASPLRRAWTFRPGWPVRRPLVDLAVVVGMTVFVWATLPVLDSSTEVDRRIGPGAFLLVAVAGTATLLRHRWPGPALLAATGATSTYLVLAYPYGPIFAFVVLTVYAAGRRLPVRHSAPLVGVALVLLLLHLATNEAAIDGAFGVVPASAWVAIPYTVGLSRRLVVAAGERERAVVAQQAVDAERLRLSQEVHDVVGHGLAAIQMQANIALHVEGQRPEQARTALEAISRASTDALEELRATLRAIHPAARDGQTAAPTAPSPGLARADELCDRVRDSGVEVTYTLAGRPRRLPTAADVAAYRVLQESLTNVVKHSAHPHADVRVTHTDDAVVLRITNQDLPSSEVRPGIGITGMERRIATLGGRFSAGPGPEPGTFTVRATIPRPDRSPSAGPQEAP